MSYSKEKFEYYKNFWNTLNIPKHSHDSKEWNDKYFKEMLFLIDNKSGDIVDAGCGNGEFLVRWSPLFKNAYGIDYSPAMVQATNDLIQKLELKNVKVSQGSIIDIDKVVYSNDISTIICNSVIQYLSVEQVNEFVVSSKKKLGTGGNLIIMNIPNVNLQEMYNIRLFKLPQKIDYFKQVKLVVKNRISLLKKKMRNRNYIHDDGIGNWFSYEDFEKIAKVNNMKIEFFNSIYPPYGYRFHVKLINE